MRLTLSGIACARGGRPLFAGLDLQLSAGGAAMITGTNGAGKSSLIRIAAGLLPPDAGRVEAVGDIALMADAAALDGERTLADALGFWARLDRRPDAAAPALAAVMSQEMAAVPVRWLSTGQRRRAALARVLASAAPIWLLDEPGNGLDAGSVAMLERLIAGHRRDGGIALVATHLPLDLPDAVAIAL